MKSFFVDAETDGLYGRFLSVAALVTDECGRELDRFYAAVKVEENEIQTPWVLTNVFPFLKNADVSYSSEDELLEAFWTFWLKHRDGAECVSYVAYPVESRLFSSCVMKDLEERCFLGPFPLYDLSTLLVAKGYGFDVDMVAMSGLDLTAHDAMNDVTMMASVWHALK